MIRDGIWMWSGRILRQVIWGSVPHSINCVLLLAFSEERWSTVERAYDEEKNWNNIAH